MHADARGFFCTLPMPGGGPDSRYCIARSARGVIRGMHTCRPPGEAKLVRCSAGMLYDVIADLRPGSATYGDWAAVMLSGTGQVTVSIPAGCAHGYQALQDGTDITYRIDAAYDPAGDIAVAWNDPELDIRWPLPPGAMSWRDRTAPSLAEAVTLLGG